MVEKSKSKISMKMFVLVTKVTPMLLAFFHLLNSILSFLGIEIVFLNYLACVSIISIAYLYFVSYTIKLCEYYRMFLHYCVVVDILNYIDYYIGLPIDDHNYFVLFIIMTIIFMFVTLYLKFFKCRS